MRTPLPRMCRSLAGPPSAATSTSSRAEPNARSDPPTITSSLPSGSATRQRSSDSSRSRPPAATVVASARLREVRRHREFDVDAVALLAPLRLRRIELLEHQHRVQAPRIVDVGEPGSPVGGVSECGDPERADGGDVGGVEEELSETRQSQIRRRPEFAGSGLEVRGEVGEVELEAVGVVLPLVLAAVDDHDARGAGRPAAGSRRRRPAPLRRRPGHAAAAARWCDSRPSR